MEIDKEKFRTRLRERADSLGYSIPFLADRLNVNRRTVKYWFDEGRLPRPETLKPLAALLNLSVTWLKYGEQRAEPPSGEEKPGSPGPGYKQEPEHMLPRGRGDDADSDRGSYGLPDLEGFGVNRVMIPEPDPEMVGELLRMAEFVLRAGHSEITPALMQNIRAFHGAVLKDMPGEKGKKKA